MRLRGFWMKIKLDEFEPKRLKESQERLQLLETKIRKSHKKKSGWLVGFFGTLFRWFRKF
jgi:hypothetical protein